MRRLIPLEKKRFGRLTVISHVKGKTWLCKCSCGKEKEVLGGNLRQGKTRSCGCLKSELSAAQGRANRTHGMTGTPEHRAWVGMRARCLQKNDLHYKGYGALGISVCTRWLESFAYFFSDMGPRPGKGYSLDRIDNDGNYEPSNCRWATIEVQNQNKRTTRFVEFGGERLPISVMARKHGLPNSTVYDRLDRGWSVERALLAPAGKIPPLTNKQ